MRKNTISLWTFPVQIREIILISSYQTEVHNWKSKLPHRDEKPFKTLAACEDAPMNLHASHPTIYMESVLEAVQKLLRLSKAICTSQRKFFIYFSSHSPRQEEKENAISSDMVDIAKLNRDVKCFCWQRTDAEFFSEAFEFNKRSCFSTYQLFPSPSTLSALLQAPLIFYFHSVYFEGNGFLLTMQRYRIACCLHAAKSLPSNAIKLSAHLQERLGDFWSELHNE